MKFNEYDHKNVDEDCDKEVEQYPGDQILHTKRDSNWRSSSRTYLELHHDAQ